MEDFNLSEISTLNSNIISPPTSPTYLFDPKNNEFEMLWKLYDNYTEDCKCRDCEMVECTRAPNEKKSSKRLLHDLKTYDIVKKKML